MRVGGLLLVAAFAGCAPDAGDAAGVGAASQAIVNGTPSNPEGSGVVQVVTNVGTFTGVLMRNRWVLSQNPGPAAMGGATVARVVMGSQSADVDAVVQWPTDGNIALLHLGTPMTMLRSTTSWRLWQFWPYSYAGLGGSTFTCYGYGDSTPTGGAGTLRSAALPVTSASATDYTLGANSAGQSLTWHDSGSPCFSGTYLMGLQVGSFQRAGGSFGAWALDTFGEVTPPRNDARANASVLNAPLYQRTRVENVAAGTTVGATHDAPASGCGCTSGADVWYSIQVSGLTAVYFDTSGSDFDTSIVVTDAAGVPVSGMCNDDASCTTGGFTSIRQSQVATVLNGGTYYVAVGGCGAGSFQLHYQSLPLSNNAYGGPLASYFYQTRLSGSGSVSTNLVGTSGSTGTCSRGASGEDARWFTTCGEQPQFFSTCQSDGGAYSRRIGTANYDPVLYVLSARTATITACNDDAVLGAGDNCTGTGGDSLQYGARLPNVVLTRGLHAVFVDSNAGPSMTYTMRYTIR